METARRRRDSLRMSGHDYSSPEAYFVTICVQDRICLFGDVVNDSVSLSVPGLVAESWWGNIERNFPAVMLGPSIVMPDYLHGVIILGGRAEAKPSDGGAKPPTLSAIIGWFKSMTTTDYLRGVREEQFPPVNGRLWQRGFYDHIIRNEESHERVAEYIQSNPARWTSDSLRPIVE